MDCRNIISVYILYFTEASVTILSQVIMGKESINIFLKGRMEVKLEIIRIYENEYDTLSCCIVSYAVFQLIG